MAAKKRKKKVEAASRGLDATALLLDAVNEDVETLAEAIRADGGTVLATYRDPLGGNPQIFAGLPIDKVEPTPYQRDISKAHVAKLEKAIGDLDRFLDPIVAVHMDGAYWTPNGHHRLSAMRSLGAKSIVALVVVDPKVAYRILALNTEKAHNLKEKSLEVIRMARSLAELGPEKESAYALEFEEAPLLTLGACYEKRARFAGSAYNPILKRVDGFLDEPLSSALEVRESRAARLLEVDDAVAEIVKELKESGFDSPYLKQFVVARLNPIRFKKKVDDTLDEILDAMMKKADDFDTGKVKPEQVAKTAGG